MTKYTPNYKKRCVPVNDFHKKILKILFDAGAEGLHRNTVILRIYGRIETTPSGIPKQSTTIYDNLKVLKKKQFINKKSKKVVFGRPPIYWFITKKGMDYVKKNLYPNRIF